MPYSAWSKKKLFQGTAGKARVIDDARKSSVNAAYGSTIKLQWQDVDFSANMPLFAMLEAKSSGLEGQTRMGKTFDLSKAYKQLIIYPGHQFFLLQALCDLIVQSPLNKEKTIQYMPGIGWIPY